MNVFLTLRPYLESGIIQSAVVFSKLSSGAETTVMIAIDSVGWLRDIQVTQSVCPPWQWRFRPCLLVILTSGNFCRTEFTCAYTMLSCDLQSFQWSTQSRWWDKIRRKDVNFLMLLNIGRTCGKQIQTLYLVYRFPENVGRIIIFFNVILPPPPPSKCGL